MKNNNNISNYTENTKLIECYVERQKAYLVITIAKEDSIENSQTRAKELIALAKTMDVEVIGFKFIKIRHENSYSLIGSGKVDELKEIIDENEATMIIFDTDLSPRIQRNLESELEICVIDRQEVILQIFADRAATKEASLQVELARLEYSLPRLTRKWTNLSRQRGGAKGNKGFGETQLEIDRRIVQNKITQTKSELETVKRIRTNQRKNRLEMQTPSVAIVGYTNSGKSSLLKKLSNSDVYVEDKLFATLDTTSKKIKMPNGETMIFTDTVGFVSNLPHNLIDAFKSTLEEAYWADIILIVLDASHQDLISCYETTKQTLKELNCENKPTVIMLNKIDTPFDDNVKSNIQSYINQPIIETSVKENIGLNDILSAIEEKYFEKTASHTFYIPTNRHDLVAFAQRNGYLENIEYKDNIIIMNAKIKEEFIGRLKEFAPDYIEKKKILEWK